MYGSKSEVLPSKSSASISYLDNGIPVIETLSSEGSYVSSSFSRSGFNDPRNGPLLRLMGKTKPKRVRFFVKKVVVGFRYIYKKVYFNVEKKKRVKTKHYVYYNKLVKRRKKNTLEYYYQEIRVYKIKYSYRYYTQIKLRFRKVAVRIPIKVRMRFPVIIPPKLWEESSEIPTKGYLLPNPLVFQTSELKMLPAIVRQDNPMVTAFHGARLLNYTVGIGYLPMISEDGLIFNFSKYLVNSNPDLSVFEDIYDSSTALHGLYKKVTSDLPSSFTSLAELPESIKAISTVLKDGIKLFKRLKHLDASGVYDSLNRLAKNRNDSLSGLSSKVWLNWYLAISPTISDVSDHIALLSREERVWRKFQKTVTNSVTNQVDNTQYGEFTSIKETTKFKCSVIIEGRVTIDEYRRRSADSGTLSSALYAVVPLSFVADWAVDISTYLESASVFEGLEYTAWQTSSTLREIFVRGIGDWAQEAETEQPVLLPYTHPYRLHDNKFRVDRYPLLSLPDMPLIPWKRNLVDQTVLNRSLTSLALLRVLGSKKN